MNDNTPKRGDLVTLDSCASGSMMIWTTWDDYDETDFNFWPTLSGKIHNNEIAIVIDVSRPDDCIAGVKVCTEKGQIGWICVKYLKIVKS